MYINFDNKIVKKAIEYKNRFATVSFTSALAICVAATAIAAADTSFTMSTVNAAEESGFGTSEGSFKDGEAETFALVKSLGEINEEKKQAALDALNAEALRIEGETASVIIEGETLRVAKAGKVQWNYTGMAKEDDGTWHYFASGLEDGAHEGLESESGKLYYFEDGEVVAYTGATADYNGLHYLEDGEEVTDFSGIAEDEDGTLWYFENGAVDTEYSDTLTDEDDNVTVIENGVVTDQYNIAEREAEEAAAAAAAVAHLRASVLPRAYTFYGVPYVSGGSTPAGFDCSGFTQYVYGLFGYDLPRSSIAQRSAGYSVGVNTLANAEPGDLIAFLGTNHVGIYIGGGRVLNAASINNACVRESPLSAFSGGYDVRRIIG